MKILNQIIYEGKNIYSHKKCIKVELDLCGYSEIPSKDIKGFNDELIAIIPELKKHRCGIDEEGGFVTRLKEGTYLAHICEHSIIAIQNRVGIDVAYGKAREIKDDKYYIIFEYEYRVIGIEAARLAVDLINALIYNEKINFLGRVKNLEEILSKESIGPSTKAIKVAAGRHGMPVFQLEDSGFYQIGYGKQGRIIEATIGAQTSCVSADIASDKELTKALLINQNIPVPQGAKVCNVISLLKEGEKIGYPLVLKPRYGCKGEGVILNISSEKELIKAYNNMKSKYKDLLIEEYIEGNDYRVCIVANSVVAVSLRKPPYVIGDGKHALKELIRELNNDSIRGYDHESPLTKVKIDDELLNFLSKQELSLNNIILRGEKVVLRQNANLSTGAIAIDCTNDISEENKQICIRVAKTIGLDICGIDIKTRDINEPLSKNGVVIEVNAAPGIRMHLHPFKGRMQDVGEAILNLQYNGKPKNIPVISITGTNGKTTTTRLISHVFRQMGYNVGMTSTDGIYIDGQCIDSGDDTGYCSAKTVLLNKEVEVAVLETARGGLIKKGLAYDLADIAVITNITEDHIGIDGINNLEELAFVKVLVGEAVKEDGYVVLNADDEWSIKIISRINAKKIFFSQSKDNELIEKNRIQGGIAVYLDKNALWVTNANKEYKILDVKNIPIALGGKLKFNLENVMAACGALVAAKIDYCMIAKSVKSFKLNEQFNSGRFNIYSVDGVEVILDYGHNIGGYKSVLKSLSAMKKERIIGVIGVPGDRRDKDICEVGSMCGRLMDEIIIKEDIDKRGRKNGEVAALLEKGIKESNNQKYNICLEEVNALKEALRISKTGDLIIVFYEQLDPLVDIINECNTTRDSLNLVNL
ncbi:cyanophycin synthetase [Clostridium vincentii]|uniref:Cyanophycin synthetase n=1 Tax=Clostridium vincentii TaxID=52704 RepID=A0A2T0BH57_9CLOT|nr:cyanophycin synthetase [Clostridium vincentii]PRR83173.1 Cyanophycin synthetase [Clostridium vincentii]